MERPVSGTANQHLCHQTPRNRLTLDSHNIPKESTKSWPDCTSSGEVKVKISQNWSRAHWMRQFSQDIQIRFVRSWPHKVLWHKALYHLQSFMSQNFMWPTSNKPNLDILGKLSHPMSPASVLGNFYYKVTRWCAVWSRCGAFFRYVMWIQSLSIPWSLVAQVLVSSARNRPFHIGWGNLFWRYLFQ